MPEEGSDLQTQPDVVLLDHRNVAFYSSTHRSSMEITQQKAGSGMAPTSLCPRTGGGRGALSSTPPSQAQLPALPGTCRCRRSKDGRCRQHSSQNAAEVISQPCLDPAPTWGSQDSHRPCRLLQEFGETTACCGHRWPTRRKG